MKTAYEWVITHAPPQVYSQYQAIKNLIKLSKQIPWILDLRVKFKELRMYPYSSEIYVFACKEKNSYYNWNVINIRYAEQKHLTNPETFLKEMTYLLSLKPGWMEIENSI